MYGHDQLYVVYIIDIVYPTDVGYSIYVYIICRVYVAGYKRVSYVKNMVCDGYGS